MASPRLEWQLNAGENRLSGLVQASTLLPGGVQVTLCGRDDIGKGFQPQWRLHWGLVGSLACGGVKWLAPPHGWVTRPDISFDAGGNAWQTPFEDGCVELHFGANVLGFAAVTFVLLDTSTQTWFKGSDGSDLTLPLWEFRDELQTIREQSKVTGCKQLQGGQGEAEETEDGVVAETQGQNKWEEESVDTEEASGPVEAPARKDWSLDQLLRSFPPLPEHVNAEVVRTISQAEGRAERSLKHRFDLVGSILAEHGDDASALVAIVVWLRLFSTRRLRWNHNYNVKPKEISAAQEKSFFALARKLQSPPGSQQSMAFDARRLALISIGRGAPSAIGQRVRDDILVIQEKNQCKGGIMEEWHQKLHNNSSPDDIIICQALIAFLSADGDLKAYWKVLHENGIDSGRLASFDRPIVSSPDRSLLRARHLKRELEKYLHVLNAVHSGSDLNAAAEKVLGYKYVNKDVQITVEPVPGIDLSRFRELLLAIRRHPDVEVQVEAAVELRREVADTILSERALPPERFADLMFLDFALETAVRTAIESQLEDLRPLEWQAVPLLMLALENAIFSLGNNKDLVLALKMLRSCAGLEMDTLTGDRALRIVAALDRIKHALTLQAEGLIRAIQPTAKELCYALRLQDPANAVTVAEEVLRNSALPSASMLLNLVTPSLRREAGLRGWDIVSSFACEGVVRVVDDLDEGAGICLHESHILVVKRIGGHEDIPHGCRGIVQLPSHSTPDILSHIAVRARNECVLLCVCNDERIATELQSASFVKLRPSPDGKDIDFQL